MHVLYITIMYAVHNMHSCILHSVHICSEISCVSDVCVYVSPNAVIVHRVGEIPIFQQCSICCYTSHLLIMTIIYIVQSHSHCIKCLVI